RTRSSSAARRTSDDAACALPRPGDLDGGRVRARGAARSFAVLHARPAWPRRARDRARGQTRDESRPRADRLPRLSRPHVGGAPYATSRRPATTGRGDALVREPRARRRHLLFASLTVLALGGMLGAGLLAWRLEHGTIDLGFLVPLVERALSRPDASFAVRIGSAELAWDVRDRRLALRACDVRVVGAGGEPVATVPALTLRPGVRALLHGILAPRAVQLIEPRLRLVRAAD